MMFGRHKTSVASMLLGINSPDPDDTWELPQKRVGRWTDIIAVTKLLRCVVDQNEGRVLSRVGYGSLLNR